jgi:crotonobetainyl-CoA:carnitine CoA-transferase CaiB-like acyl-CoA transferase
MGAASAVAALLARERVGGQYVEVSVLAGALSLQTGGIMRHEKMTSPSHGAQDPLGPIPCYRLFEASDGGYLFIACGNTTFWNKLTLAIERPELVSDPRFENAPWGVPTEHWQALKDIISPIIRTRPRDEWLKILRANDVPCAPVLSRQEFIEEPQVRSLAMRQEIIDPALGPTVQMGIPVELHDTPGNIRGAAPCLKSDDVMVRELLATPSSSDKPTMPKSQNAMTTDGPLAGVLVLDFTSYIAGSYGPMILGQMGADVIKIESLQGDSFRAFGFGFLGWNQQKRSIALDFRTREAREIVCALAAKADVVVENLRPGGMRKLGLDYEALAAINPRIVYMSVNAFGNRGPDYDRPGFDPLLQAYSGVMAAQGGHGNHPVYLTCAICDYGAAMLSAFGCILGLAARNRTGHGQFCETSLLQAAMAYQAGEFVFYEGRPDLEENHPESRGRRALSRAYECSDGKWLFIDVKHARQWSAMREISSCGNALSLEQASREESEGVLAAELVGFFRALTRDEALEKLALAAVPAQRVNRFADLLSDPLLHANDLLVELKHSKWGQVIQTGMLTKFSATPGAITRAAPMLGEHTEDVLMNVLGYDAARISDLKARKIIQSDAAKA